MPNSNSGPYEALGTKIKHLREQWKQSIGEVCGTLEIDEVVLKDIESGKFLPPEDILNMLISHFLLTEEQAEDLRQLAALHREQNSEALLGGIEDMLMKQIVMYLPVDSRIVYTDSMKASINRHGIILQFMQSPGPNSKPVAVSQVGMSREHAERIIKVLQDTLAEHDRKQQPKLLPEKTTDSKKKSA